MLSLSLTLITLVLNGLAFSIASDTVTDDAAISNQGPYRLIRERHRPKRGAVALDTVLSENYATRKNCGLVEVNFNL